MTTDTARAPVVGDVERWDVDALTDAYMINYHDGGYVTFADYQALTARVEAAEGLLREARPFVDTCPDLVRPGGDELAARIDAAIDAMAPATERGGG